MIRMNATGNWSNAISKALHLLFGLLRLLSRTLRLLSRTDSRLLSVIRWYCCLRFDFWFLSELRSCNFDSVERLCDNICSKFAALDHRLKVVSVSTTILLLLNVLIADRRIITAVTSNIAMMDVFMALAVILAMFFVIYKFVGGKREGEGLYPDLIEFKKNNSLLNMFNARHINAIVDQFTSAEAVSKAIRQAGLESSNLIFGIDYTKSNTYQGEKSFEGRCLHHVETGLTNPYQHVIRILGSTLSHFDDDGIIPAFGFGDVSTKDKSVFPFRAEGYCHGFEDVLNVYTQLTPNVTLSGPTNFAPLIYQAIEIVKQTRSYHILVIVADGQVTSERSTRDAIVEAAKWPLSIIMVGVGDGPWETMREFDDELPQRQFDNFQFVDFNKVLTFAAGNPDQTFALHALMEVPDQYKTIRKLGLLDF